MALIDSIPWGRSTLCLLVVGILVRLPGITQPIQEGYRNAQTATLTAGMTENGRFRLDPIAPWRGTLDARLVLEFPLYNFLVIGANSFPGVSLDVAGRIISLLCWLASFVLLQILWKQTLNAKIRLWANMLFVFSPMNWYLSTAFMPETLLQLLSIGFILSVLGYARFSSMIAFFCLCLTGGLGLLVKFPGFVHLGLFAILVLNDRQNLKALFKTKLMIAALLLVTTVVVWGAYINLVNTPDFPYWTGQENLLGFIRPHLSRLSLRYYLPLAGYNVAFIFTLAGLPFVLLGLLQYARTFSSSFASRLWLYLLFSLACCWLLWAKGAREQSYYNLPNLILFCASFATGVRKVSRVLKNTKQMTAWGIRVSGVALAILIFLLGLIGYLYLRRPDATTVAAAEWIRVNTVPQDIVILQPRHAPSVIDYEHQPLLSHYSGRRTWIWTRLTAPADKERALLTSDYAVITHPREHLTGLERFRCFFKGTPPPPPLSINDLYPHLFKQVYSVSDYTIYKIVDVSTRTKERTINND